MSKQKYESMWVLMKENNFEIPRGTSSEFICTICKGLLIDACSTPCGCRYCRQCISEYLKGKCKQCPGTSESCKDDELNIDCDIQVDQVINNRISKLKVKCPNFFCKIQLDIRSMENHLETCVKETVTCPFTNIGCVEDKLSNDKLNEHLLSEINSHTKLLMDWVNISRNETELLKKDIQHLRSDNDDLKSINNDMKKKLEINENIVRDLQKKNKENYLEIKRFGDEVCYLKNANQYLNEKFQSLQIQGSEQRSNLDLKTQIEKKIQLIDQFEKQNQVRKTQFDKILEIQHNKNQNLEKKFDEISMGNAAFQIDLNRKIENHAQLINESLEFVWKFKNWSKLRRESQRGIADCVCSQPFFSHKNGYKLKIRLSPDGHLDAKGTHLSIFFVIMRGQNDDFLQWPFKYGIEFTLMNQQTGLPQLKSFLQNFNPFNQALIKPVTEENEQALGVHKFIELSKISTIPGLHQHDQIVIKCLVYRF